jgi:ribose/xylose/arabinose/galactoside ABC-type transport system permease subunit
MKAASHSAPERENKARRHSEAWHHLKWPLIALAAVLLFNFLFTPLFFHLEVKDGRIYGSLIDILNRAAPVMLLCLGMTIVIATGGVDLSVGAMMAMAGSIAALLITKSGYSFISIVLLTVFACGIAGTWNGILVAYAQVQPIVATLILMVAGRGIAQLLTNGQIITFENPAFAFFGGGKFLALPFPITIVAATFVILSTVVNRTAAGLFIEAVGDNEKASNYSGINTRLVKLAAYTLSGICAGLAGLIVASDIKAADANNAGLYLELDAILAVVVGGTALTGGRFYLLSSLAGALLIQTITTTILTRAIPVEFTLIVKAVVIIIVCLLQSEEFRKKALQLVRRKS